MLNSRVALVLAILALFAAVGALYVPASQVSAQIDSALQQEDDAIASALKSTLLAEASRRVMAAATLIEAQASSGANARYGEAMREALGVDAIMLLDARDRVKASYATFETPSGLAKTTATHGLAKQARVARDSHSASGFVRAYGQAYIAAAMTLDGANGAAGDGRVAVVFTRIEKKMLARLSRNHGLVGLDLVEAVPSDNASLALYDIAGGTQGFLTWQKASPTQRMLEALGPWVIAVLVAAILVFAILAILALRANRRAATARLAAEVLERADKAKSLLFANLSHEFRTPLNAVLGFSEVMQRRLFGPLGHPKYAEYADDIHASAGHLLGLIEDVLTLSRYEANEGITLNDTVDLNAAVDDITRMLAQSAAKKNLALIVEPMAVTMVAGSAKSVRQVLTNLIGNAIKYTETGFVRIAVRQARRAGEVDIEICDSGIGIPAEHLERIVRPFEQVDDVYARSQGGTGLGLSIVTTILQRAGGTMRIDSEFGSGTQVTVTLRRAMPVEVAAAA